MSLIAVDIKKPPATVFSYLLYHGSIEPRTRSRRPDALSFDEHEFISRSLARGDSMRTIAKALNRAPSSISREIARNGGVNRYRAALAEKAFLKHAKRPKPMLLAENTRLRDIAVALPAGSVYIKGRRAHLELSADLWHRQARPQHALNPLNLTLIMGR